MLFRSGSIEERLKQLQDAHRDFGPGSQHFLSSKRPLPGLEVAGLRCITLVPRWCRAVERLLWCWGVGGSGRLEMRLGAGRFEGPVVTQCE